MATLIIVVAIIAIAVIFAVVWFSIYNNLVEYKNELNSSESQIGVQLERRADLIPNLVNTVKGYAAHEKSTFEEITKFRSLVADKKAPLEDRLLANDEMSKRLASVNVSVEAYPDLKASQNFLNLQEELTNTENKIAYARQNYNKIAKIYNTKIQTFPNSIVAGSKFIKADFLEVPASKAEVPNVKFD